MDFLGTAIVDEPLRACPNWIAIERAVGQRGAVRPRPRTQGCSLAEALSRNPRAVGRHLLIFWGT